MKIVYILILIFGTVIAGGCAKHEMVKSDEIIPPTTSSKSTVTEKPALKETAVKSEPIREASLKDKTIDVNNAAGTGTPSGTSLEKIYFDFDSYLLSPAARETLVRNARQMKEKRGVKILIEGNCDERGSDEYNLALGEKRAKSAMHYLVSLGVPAGRLSVISYGKEKPADPGHDDASWAKNRRDEFAVTSK